MKNYVLSLVILLIGFCPNQGYSQKSKTDSLELLISQNINHDTVRVNLLNSTAYYFYRKNSTKTLDYATEAQAISKEIGYKKGNAESNRMIGIYHMVNQDKEKGILFFEKGLELFQEINDTTGITATFFNIAVAYRLKSDYTQAIEYNMLALKINQEAGNKLEVSRALDKIGIMYKRLGKFPKALEYYERSLKIVEELGDKKLIAKRLNNIGSVYITQGNFPKALDYYQKSRKIYTDIEDKEGLASVLHNIGIIYKERKDYDQSLTYYKKALTIAEELNDEQDIAETLNNIGSLYNEQGRYIETINYLERSLALKQEVNDKKGISVALSNIGKVYLQIDQKGKAKEYLDKALVESTKINSKRMLCDCYKNLGEWNLATKNHKKALELSLKSLEIANALKLLTIQRDLHENLSEIYRATGKYQKAFDNYVKFKQLNDSIFNDNNVKKLTGLEFQYEFDKEKQAIQLEQTKKDAIHKEEVKQEKTKRNFFIVGFAMMAILTLVILRSFIQKRKANTILDQQKTEIEYKNEELNQLNEEVLAQRNNIEQSYKSVKKLSEIGQQITSSLDVLKIIETIYSNVNNLMDAEVFDIGIYNPATSSLDFPSGIERGYKLDFKSEQIRGNKRLSVLCFNLKKEIVVNNFKSEYKDFVQLTETTDGRKLPSSALFLPLSIKDKVIGIITVQSHDTNAYSDYDLSMLKNIGSYTAIALDNADAYKQIEAHKTQIETDHRHITASINYAERIQSAVLPRFNVIKNGFAEHFILFKPRDVVSGDFYWFKQIKEYTVVIAADCTGHGVPGAFMSMLGIAFLNELILKEEIATPAQLLDGLREKVKAALKQTGKMFEQQDGMDISACFMNNKTNSLQFAGANNPLFILRENPNINKILPFVDSKIIANDEYSLLQIKPDKQPIGVYKNEKPFTNHKINLECGDLLYMFSDGYPDQIGGPKNRKFLSKHFKTTLLEINSLSLPEQKSFLNNTLAKWQGEQVQVDDILIIGLRV